MDLTEILTNRAMYTHISVPKYLLNTLITVLVITVIRIMIRNDYLPNYNKKRSGAGAILREVHRVIISPYL